MVAFNIEALILARLLLTWRSGQIMDSMVGVRSKMYDETKYSENKIVGLL